MKDAASSLWLNRMRDLRSAISMYQKDFTQQHPGDEKTQGEVLAAFEVMMAGVHRVETAVFEDEEK